MTDDVADRPASSAIEDAWEDPPRRSQADAAPVLVADGFEGPIDWLVEQVRAGRIDLARLPVVALVGAFADALDAVLDGTDKRPATLARWGAWLVLAAELALLRSRLMVPAGQGVASVADEAEVLRRRVRQRAEAVAVADWLERQPRLGREVWGRGVPEKAGSSQRSGDVTGLFRACLVALKVPEEVAAAFRVRLPFWTMADAIGRICASLPKAGEGGVLLECFLPRVMGMGEAPDYQVRCRAAVAGTFMGALELTRQGVIGVWQDAIWAPVRAE